MDSSQGWTQYRQAGKCFMLSEGFDDAFSTDMDEWFTVGILYYVFFSRANN